MIGLVLFFLILYVPHSVVSLNPIPLGSIDVKLGVKSKHSTNDHRFKQPEEPTILIQLLKKPVTIWRLVSEATCHSFLYHECPGCLTEQIVLAFHLFAEAAVQAQPSISLSLSIYLSYKVSTLRQPNKDQEHGGNKLKAIAYGNQDSSCFLTVSGSLLFAHLSWFDMRNT